MTASRYTPTDDVLVPLHTLERVLNPKFSGQDRLGFRLRVAGGWIYVIHEQPVLVRDHLPPAQAQEPFGDDAP